MQLPILYIGFSQAFFAVVLILMKKPLKIADIILSALLMSFTLLFGMNILQEYNILNAMVWIFPLSISMTFAPLLYLYSKYVTYDFNRFNPLDYLHALPIVLTVLLFLIFRAVTISNTVPDEISSIQFPWLRYSIGYVYIILFFVYTVFAIRIVIRFKKQIKHYYSFRSDKISLNWLLVVIIIFGFVYFVIIINSILIENKKTTNQFDVFRNIMHLFFVYTISIWGLKQTQLFSEFKFISNSDKILNSKDSASGKYLHSGLKKEQAENYLQKLFQYMDKSEAWKDNELSIAQLSAHINIPKHHITQVLNENLGKNFYQFVNEYRTEYAKRLLKSQRYASWSILAIAYECGFNSKTAFNSFFKKNTQMTPSDFKKNSRKRG